MDVDEIIMNPEFVKLFIPALLVIAWVRFSLRVRTPLLIGAGLFFMSYAAFSSNFTFIYRDLYQFIQIILILVFIVPAIMNDRFLRVNSIFIIILFFISISFVYAPLDEDSKSQLINFLVSVGVVNYLFSAIRTGEDLDKVLRFLAYLAVLLACIGIAEFTFITQARIETTFSNSNYYGLFLGVGSCIVIVTWRGRKKNIASVIIISAIILSGSRSALVFPVLQFFWIIYQRRNFREFLQLFFAFIIIGVFIFSSGLTRYTSTSQTEASDAERIIFAKIAVQMANDHPLTGIGWGRFIVEFGKYSTNSERILISSGLADVSGQDRRVTHNDYLRILAELGWIAFIMSIALSIYGIKILLINKGFGLDYMLPIYLGMLLFSVGHNNLNGAFFWFFFLLPFFFNSMICRCKNISFEHSQITA